MTSKSQTIQLGMTGTFACSYLPSKQEQLLVLQEDHLNDNLFEHLLALGFRRSGGTIYKPQCPQCNACLPIRIPVEQFVPSRRQKRTMRNNRDLSWRIADAHTPAQYALYERYVNERHKDGPMYPATPEQYQQFVKAKWTSPILIEILHEDELIGVAVTDVLPNSLSAIYSFFAPEQHKRSLGNMMILIQLQLAKLMRKSFIYLGYQIDESRKMNYKRNFHPYQVLTQQGWLQSEIDK
ncbi:arginyltransferase [Shewanella sp. Scap07]|uniref:arginyltransferase n=1 Tax=Shewanella TaxID=22 RepID=UPI00048F9712|nr:arginyltransferase [Shewanella sp. Scap07]